MPEEVTQEKSLTQEQLTILKSMFVIRLLDNARKNPALFPDKDGMVITSEDLKCKALSKAEILRWQHSNTGGDNNRKMTEKELDTIIEFSGMIFTLKKFKEGTQLINCEYFFLP